jgi:hypothetical protein
MITASTLLTVAIQCFCFTTRDKTFNGISNVISRTSPLQGSQHWAFYFRSLVRFPPLYNLFCVHRWRMNIIAMGKTAQCGRAIAPTYVIQRVYTLRRHVRIKHINTARALTTWVFSTDHKHIRNVQMAVFWVVPPCSLAEVYRRFRGPCCFHHRGDRQTRLHGATTQKTAIFILATVRTSDPTIGNIFHLWCMVRYSRNFFCAGLWNTQKTDISEPFIL